MAKAGGSQKVGRNKQKCARYRGNHTREKNKLRRILRSNGVVYAEEYTARHGMSGYLARVK